MLKVSPRFLFPGTLVVPIGRSAPPASDYELLFAGEFNGDRVTERDWSFRTGPGTDQLNFARDVRVATFAR